MSSEWFIFAELASVETVPAMLCSIEEKSLRLGVQPTVDRSSTPQPNLETLPEEYLALCLAG